VFWRAESHGYTVFLDEAGRYDSEQLPYFDTRSFAVPEAAVAPETVRPIVLRRFARSAPCGLNRDHREG